MAVKISAKIPQNTANMQNKAMENVLNKNQSQNKAIIFEMNPAIKPSLKDMENDLSFRIIKSGISAKKANMEKS